MSLEESLKSGEIENKLFSLGIFPQENGSIAISERIPKFHEDECVYIVRYDSMTECVKYLRDNLDDLKQNYLSVWDELRGIVEKILEESDHKVSNFDEDLRDMFLYRLINLCYRHDSLRDIYDKIEELDSHSEIISDYQAKVLGYYSTILAYMSAELCVENKRLEDIEAFLDEYGEYKIRKIIKVAYASGLYGRDGGIGYHGLTNPLTPFGNYDYFEDRVMDGTTIHDQSGGHATEKFLEYNKFRRHPDLLRKKHFKYKSKPLRYLKRRLKCKKKYKNKHKHRGRLNVGSTGLIYVDVESDPAYYYWWDQQRNNPYLFDSRSTDGVYPTWSSYGK